MSSAGSATQDSRAVTTAADQLEVVSPATGERLGAAPILGTEQVRELAARARAAQPAWQALGFDARAVIFRRMQRWLLNHRDEILASVEGETGRAYEDSLLELAYAVTAFGYWAAHSKRYLRPERARQSSPFVLGKRLRTTYQPRGLIGVIVPWNFPVVIGVGDMLPALAAGNAVIVKPSESTPFSMQIVRRGLIECGMPADVLQIATGAGPTGAAVVDVVDMVMFTGSTATGKHVGAQAAGRLIPASLELGGKDPMIVLADANLERAANLAVLGGMVNSGQICLSTERVYVEAAVYDDFVQRVVSKVAALRQGPPNGPGSVDIGAIITPAQMAIIDSHVQDAVSKGARVLTGGQPLDSSVGRFYQPTVLVDVDHTMKCMQEETFGPTLPIMKVADPDEAVRLANDTRYGLAATICTTNQRRGRRLAGGLECGTVSINDIFTHCFALGMPMGGVKTSGIGTRHGAEGIRKYCEKQSVLASRFHLSRDVHMHPYSARTSNRLVTSLRVVYGTTSRIAQLTPRALVARGRLSNER